VKNVMRGSKKKNTCENTNPKFIHINRHILIGITDRGNGR